MGKTGQFIHRTSKQISTSFDSTYVSSKFIEISLNAITDGANASIIKQRRVYSGNIQLIRIKGTTTGSPSQITMKGYTDIAGDDLLLPPSVSTLVPSIDGTTHSVAFRVNAYHAAPFDELYLFCKTNTGTFDATEILITWFE
jgi:hypothetical protein